MISQYRSLAETVTRLFYILTMCLWLNGCASIPPVLDYASMALSGISYISTGKGASDHAISYATKKDCTLLRALMMKPICIEMHVDTNKPFWVQLFKERKDEFPNEIPMPPRLDSLPDTEVVQLD